MKTSRILKYCFAAIGITAFIGGVSHAVPISLVTPAVAVTENFDSLANSGTSNTAVPSGWEQNGTSGTYAAGTGSSATGDIYSFGAASATDRALGELSSGSFAGIFGVGYTNNTGSTIVSLDISYFGEQWRIGDVTATTDRLNFQYSVNATSTVDGAATWIDVDPLDFASINTTGPTTGAQDGNVLKTSIASSITGLSITNGNSFYLRWLGGDIGGSDDGLGVDDYSLTPQVGVIVNNDTTITPDSLAYNFGRVVNNGSPSILLDKTGVETTTFSTAEAGAGISAPNGNFIAGTVSDQALPVTFTGANGTNVSGTVTVDNQATTSAGANQGSADPDDVVNVSADIVGDRFVNSGRNNNGADANINASLNNFGSIIVGQSKTQNIDLTTSNSGINDSTAEGDTHLTRITIPASVTTTNVGTVPATTSIADSVADLVNDGGDVVTRSMTVSPTTTGSFSATSGNYTRFSTTGEGLVGETSDPHSRIYYQFTGLTSANASFAASDDNDITINLGNFTQGTGTQNPGFAFDLYNLITTAGFTAGLDLTGFLAGLGDSEVLISLLNSVNNLSEGLSTNVTGNAAIDTNTAPGLLSRVFTLQLRDDENIAGFQAQTLDLTLEANIVAIPEPSSLVLVAMGAVALLRRRRRCS